MGKVKATLILSSHVEARYAPLVEQIHSPQYGAMRFGRELVVAGTTSRGFR